jgi:hypothetical protein
MQVFFEVGLDQGAALFGAENEMHEKVCGGVWHSFLSPLRGSPSPSKFPTAYAVGFILFAATRLVAPNCAVALTPGSLRPKCPIQRPVLDGFGDVFWGDRWGAFEVGYRSGYL